LFIIRSELYWEQTMSLRAHFYHAVAWAGVINKDHHLQHAACRGYAGAVKALLEAGANLHAQDDLALRLAAFYGRNNVVRTLLEAGADVHAHDDGPLRWARDARRTDTIKTLEAWVAREQKPSPTAPRLS
jgi:Ankyrin repeats (3 copies)